MHKFLKDAAALAASSVDKGSAAQLAASLSERIASRTDSPVSVRVVARLVAQGLNASLQQQPVHAPERSAATGQASALPGAPSDGWQQALRVLQGPATKPSSATAGAGSPRPPTARTATPAARREAPTVFRGTLTGYYDVANIGAFSFSLYNARELQVDQLRAPGNVGGRF